MTAADIVDWALACYRTPLAYQDRLSLAASLPEGIDRLLWLANGSPEALEAGIQRTGAKPQELRDAARFCIQQLCFARGADHYRVLGVESGAPPERIKEHYRLLMRLFHPDRAAGRETWTEHYASRVNEAWTALSRAQDLAVQDSQPCPRVPAWDTVSPVAERAVERPRPPLVRDHPGRGFRARRRWLPRLVVGGLLLAAVMGVLGGFYLDRSRFELASGAGSDPPADVATASESAAAPVAEQGPLGPFLTAPDWRALEQREQQAQQQVAQLREKHEQLEQSRREQIAAEEALLEKMRAERSRLEEQVKIEQARVEQARAERLVAERQRLAQLQVEQARVEQTRTERQLAERRRLEELQVEQAKAERLADELRAERRQMERAKVEQAKVEQAKVEQVKAERVQAERQRLAEQARAEQARAEQARVEQARAEQARAEQARLDAAANRAPAVSVVVADAAPDRHDLTAADLENLMSRYTRAYEQGDLNSVMALFGAGARGRVRRDYAALFATHQVRGLWLRDFRWFSRGGFASGSGRYELRLEGRDDGEPRQMKGNIRFTVQKRGSRVLIEAIEYDWPGS